MKGALVAPTCDTLLNYNFCQSNNQFEEAATHDLKSQHPQPHTEGLLSVNSAALLALIKSSFPKFCGCLPGRRCAQNLCQCERGSYPSCNLARYWWARRRFFAWHKSTRGWFSSAANFLLLRALTKFTAGVSCVGALKLVREIKDGGALDALLDASRKAVYDCCHGDFFCQCHAWLLVHQQESGFVSFLFWFNARHSLITAQPLYIQDWATGSNNRTTRCPYLGLYGLRYQSPYILCESYSVAMEKIIGICSI
jgi:hypothetical protein